MFLIRAENFWIRYLKSRSLNLNIQCRHFLFPSEPAFFLFFSLSGSFRSMRVHSLNVAPNFKLTGLSDRLYSKPHSIWTPLLMQTKIKIILKLTKRESKHWSPIPQFYFYSTVTDFRNISYDWICASRFWYLGKKISKAFLYTIPSLFSACSSLKNCRLYLIFF